MGLLERIAATRDIARRSSNELETRFSADDWLNQYLLPTIFGYNGSQYVTGPGTYGLVQTLDGKKSSEIAATLPGYSLALRSCPPAFAAQMVRALVLSQARFVFRYLPSHPKARQTFGTPRLTPLEQPWTNATTGELIARMEWHAGIAGNAYVYRQPDRLRVLRPDWVALVYGSQQEPEDAAHSLDGQLIGYVYQNGGLRSSQHPMHTMLPDEVAHWSPLPDPEAAGVGMSWITPALREIQGDRAATDHKLRFFENGATPNMVVSGLTAGSKEQFDEMVDALEGRHTGLRNAYRTLYLTQGADAKVVGSDLKQLDFKNTQGAGETRIAFLSRVPAPLLGISEGLAGSSLNAGNFGMARRIFADSWIYPTLQDLCASLAPIINVPRDAELWFDTGDMPILREDARDAAEIQQIQGQTITNYVREGFTSESAIAAVRANDVNLLKPTGLVSVQLYEPTAQDHQQSGTGLHPIVRPVPGNASGGRPAD